MAKKIVAATVVAAGLVAMLWYSQRRTAPGKISGFMEADEIRLGSRVGGRVEAIHVQEGQKVKAGEVLVELAPFDLRQRQAQAEAAVAQRQAELDKLVAGSRAQEIAQAKARRDELAAKLAELEAGPRKETIDAARARLASAKAQEKYAQAALAKIRASFEQHVATQEELDRSVQLEETGRAATAMRAAELAELEAGARKEDLAIARAQLEQAGQALALQEAGSRAEDVAAARAALAAGRAALKVIEAQIDELKIVAPVDGVVEAFDLRPGDMVNPNAPALSILDPRKLWVRAFLPEDSPGVTVGQRVVVTVDAYPDRKFAARVGFIARQAEFTPSNVQTPEKRSKQVFRVKVYLEEGLDVLRAGMPADVWLDAKPK